MKTRAFSLGSARPRIERSEVQGGETSPLELLRNRVEGIRLLQKLHREILAVLLWLEAKLFCPSVVPIASRVVRDTPHRHVADVGHRNTLHHQLHEILAAEPSAQVPKLLRRHWVRRADAHAYTLDAVLIPIHAGHRLAPDLRQT